MTDPKTLLTEQQARSLALWWGAEYQRTPKVAGENLIRHGVVVSGLKACHSDPDTDSLIWVFSLEEAQEMENRRGFQEAASPDWIG